MVLDQYIPRFLALLLLSVCNKGIDCHTVFIVTDPVGTPVNGQPNTFDYPILSSVTLICMTTMTNASQTNVTSYHWIATNCYTHNAGVRDTCFYSGDQTGQNITGTNLLAQDAGTATCNATIDGVEYTSDPLTLRISGISLTGGDVGTTLMGDGTSSVEASNVLDDYSYIYLYGNETGSILFRCSVGLGPIGNESNNEIGSIYYNNMPLTESMCSGFMRAEGAINIDRFPGIYHARYCGQLSTSTEGIYTCTLRNSSMMNQSMSVGVYFSGRTAPVITAIPTSPLVNVIIGSFVTLTCLSSGSPPDTFSWKKDGVPITQSTNITTVHYNSTDAVFSNSYIINDASMVDNGTYVCDVVNPIGSDSYTFTVNILSPAISPKVMDQSQNEGDTASFTCQAVGEPVPTITWYFNDAPITNETNVNKYDILQSSVNSTTLSNTLTIMGIESSDVGTYTCNATNLLSSDISSGILTVNVAPNILTPMEGHEFNITKGNNGSITCTVTGYPVPTVVWQNSDGSSLSNNRLVSSSPMISSTDVGNVTRVSVELIVIRAMREDTGMYRCSANNSVDHVAKNIVVVTQFTPAIWPRVIDQTQFEGDDVVFICQASGEPVPAIKWYFSGTIVNVETDLNKFNVSQSSINITTINNILTVMNVESSDVGTYTCNATNVVSSDTSSGVLTVNVAPNITTPMEGQQFNITEGSGGSITCTATGYPVPIVTWQNSDGNSLSNDRLVSSSPVILSTGVGNVTSVSVELMVLRAMRIETGMYKCSANNSVDNTTTTVQFVITQFTLMIKSVTETSITLSWTEPSVLTEEIVYYQIYYTSNLMSTQHVNITSTDAVLNNLMAGVQYSILVTAVSNARSRINSSVITILTLNTALFQIRLQPIGNCEEWIKTDREEKQSDIKAAIIQEIVMHCSCEFNSSNIIDDIFSCQGSEGQHKNSVVYRALINLQVLASNIDADNIVNIIDNWVQSEPSVIVNEFILSLDPGCPAMLDSVSSDDCVTEAPPPDHSDQSSSSLSIGIIVGAAAAAAVIILLLIIIIVGTVMYRRYKSSYSVTSQKQQNEYDYVTTLGSTSGANNQVNQIPSKHNTMLPAVHVNPTYQDTAIFTNKHTDNEDQQYEIMYPSSRERNTLSNITLESNMIAANPIYDGAYFTNKSVTNEDGHYEVMYPESEESNANNTSALKHAYAEIEIK